MKVKVSDLKLGDVVQLFNDAYGTATVYRKDPQGNAQVWRPYVKTEDFAYSGGVIPYIGLEDFSLWSGTEVERIREGAPLR